MRTTWKIGIVLGGLMAALAAGGAAAQTPSDQLAALCLEYWEGTLRADPLTATTLGDRRFDPLLEDITPEGRRRELERLAGVEARVLAIPAGELPPPRRVDRSALLEVIGDRRATLEAWLDLWIVDPLGGPQVSFLNIPSYQPVETPEQARAMVQRWRAMGPYVDAHVANLQAGLRGDGAHGAPGVRAATQIQVDRVVDQLNDLLAKPTADWALLEPLAAPHPDWPAAERQAFERDLRAAVEDVVRPAFERYRDFLVTEVRPVARSQDKPGLMHLPDGGQAYSKLVRAHTSLDLQPEEIHRIGLREVERINGEMRELGRRVLGTDDLPEILRRLRADSTLYFDSRAAVEAKAREALGRAREAIPQWFGVLPQAPCEVVRMPEFEEEHSTIAYYRQPAIDGSRPGQYFINTFAPATRPRYEAEALAFHEAIPGHHLQIAIAQELHGVPEFRKHSIVTAFAEGWGLYSERLADEMGLYSSDLDRIGMLSFDAWRACRLVVDTGMHALGWSRQQAIDFMLANSALAENNITNEVDRYISWPGQALAYKLGQLEILRLRDEVRRRQGAHFDIKAFHDLVLRNGAVSLATLRQVVEEATR